MKKAISTCFAVAAVAMWGVAAQGQEAPQRPAPPSDGPSQSAPAPAPDAGAKPAETTTIAGCLAKAGEAFRLTDAKAPAGAAAGADVEDEYALEAGAGVALAPHVDHQVEVTGRASAAGAGAPSFMVSSVKMIAAECE